ncbi:MAG: glycosyl transferase, partial [Porticoccaceae bacterium]|nr:glycosyl transferase [Porticoccaceae bacterium]
MGDFHQNGIITTLHNLGKRSLSEMERELLGFSSVRPLGLILPSLYSELEGQAMPKIVSELQQVPYLNQIV